MVRKRGKTATSEGNLHNCITYQGFGEVPLFSKVIKIDSQITIMLLFPISETLKIICWANLLKRNAQFTSPSISSNLFFLIVLTTSRSFSWRGSDFRTSAVSTWSKWTATTHSKIRSQSYKSLRKVHIGLKLFDTLLLYFRSVFLNRRNASQYRYLKYFWNHWI